MTDDALTDDQYSLADRIERVMESASAGTSWTPSALGRRLKEDAVAVRRVLDWMVRHEYVRSEGNGARTRYIARWR